MLRRLSFAIAIILMISPLSSQALGLGKMQTNSGFNQPLEAEINLLSLAPGEVDDIKVALASKEVFARADADRPFFLSRLKFQTIKKENGKAAIRVYSREPITEPYLNFLIEVNWPKGQLVREFSVLLEIN